MHIPLTPARLAIALAAGVLVAALRTAAARADDPSPAPSPPNQVSIEASTSLQPLAKAAAAKFGLQYTGVSVTVVPSDSGDALRALSSGNVDVALTDRAPGDTNLLDHKIAVLPFVLIANHADGVSSLTNDQIAGLLTGKITNWSQAGGPNVPVKIVNRGAGSGVTRLAEAKFLKGQKATAADSVANATGTAIDEVKSTPGAVAIVPLSAARAANANVNLLAIEGATPDESHVGDGSYPLWAYEHAVTAGAPSTQTSRFLGLLESDRSMLHSLGFLAVSELGPGALTP